VRNSSNVIVGGPGSGKTTFLLQFLWIGATKFEENGLYCSFEPDIVEVLSDARWFGWDFSKLAQEGRVQFLKFSPQTSINELRGELTKLISKHNIKRICFDPVSVLALNLSESGKIREVIFDLVSLMKRLNVTSILADESFEAEHSPNLSGDWSKTDILRFLTDSITTFYEGGIQGVSDRALRINKMRRTNHNRKAVGMKISEKGVEVISPDNVDTASNSVASTQ
jgi:circadian clock protein KaiC